MVLLFKATGRDLVAGGVDSIRAASGVGYRTLPTDAEPNTAWEPRLVQPGTYERHLFTKYATRGRSSTTYGVCKINNADKALNAKLAWIYAGYPLEIRNGPATGRGSFPGDYPLIFAGTCDGALPSRTTLDFRIRDQQRLVSDLLIDANAFGGTNALPNGLDGTADVKGQYKTQPYAGPCQNVTVTIVNTSLQIGFIADANLPVGAIGAAYIGGGVLSLDTSGSYPTGYYSTTAQLQSTAVGDPPANGKYRLYSGAEGTYIRWGGSITGGTPTVDVTEGATAADRLAGATMQRLLINRGGILASNILGAAALDSLFPVTVAYWGASGSTCGPALDAMAGSVGGYWANLRGNSFKLGQLQLPDPNAVTAAFGKWNTLDIRPQPDELDGVPASQIQVGYAQSWTVSQQNSIPTATLAQQQFASQQYRYVTSPQDTSLIAAQLAQFPTALPLTIPSLAVTQTDAQKLADFFWARYGVPRKVYELDTTIDQALATDLGDTVYVKLPYAGLDDGAYLRVLGEIGDLATNKITLVLWR